MFATQSQSRSQAALLTLIILQFVMLAALFSGTAPHPPRVIVLFGLGPFLGASLAIAAAAMVLGATDTKPGMAASAVAAALSLLSFGPQKWMDPAIGEIWPAVLVAEIATFALLTEVLLQWRAGRSR